MRQSASESHSGAKALEESWRALLSMLITPQKLSSGISQGCSYSEGSHRVDALTYQQGGRIMEPEACHCSFCLGPQWQPDQL